MNAFISYSHLDSHMLDVLHKHLAQLKRDNTLSAWTDREIPAGGQLDQAISQALGNAGLFIALLSPGYIASNYCYEIEFQEALKRQAQGSLIIVPVILEPCDWLSTPFSKFKALPRDGKAVGTWSNINTAFLDIIQGLRQLLSSSAISLPSQPWSVNNSAPVMAASRNYRVQKDFDSLEKLEFAEKTFREVKELLAKYLEEIVGIENIKARILQNEEKLFKAILVNRNKIATEAVLIVSVGPGNAGFGFQRSQDIAITYAVNQGNASAGKGFMLSYDEYHMFWTQQQGFYTNMQSRKEYEAKDIADVIWNEWLETVGIM